MAGPGDGTGTAAGGTGGGGSEENCPCADGAAISTAASVTAPRRERGRGLRRRDGPVAHRWGPIGCFCRIMAGLLG